MRTFMKYGAGLIGIYLAVVYATGAGTLINATTDGAVNLTHAFQGR